MRLPLALLLPLAAALLAACGSSAEPASAPQQLRVSTAGWSTDFSVSDVPLSEFRSGGPPKDGIPSIDDPSFVSVEQADSYLEDSEPLALLELDGVARAYPIRILTWHEIVNDEIGGRAVAVTYCPLCNSTVAFDRELGGRTLEFGTTGNLRNSDLVMYDRETESWWQQTTAEAVVGELTGTRLELLPSRIVSWGELKRLRGGAEVLSRETGFDRDYETNPYAGYDADPEERPFLLEGDVSGALPPKERVTAVRDADGVVVYPLARLRRQAPLNDEIGARKVVVLVDPQVGSSFDPRSEVGAAAVYERELRGRTLTFERLPGDRAGVVDRETGTRWSFLGEAVAGPLAGERLTPVPSDDGFWFAVAAFYEDPEIRR